MGRLDGNGQQCPTVKRVREGRDLCATVNPSSLMISSVTPRLSAERLHCRAWRDATVAGMLEERYTQGAVPGHTYQGVQGHIHQGVQGGIPPRVYQEVSTHQGIPGGVYPPGYTRMYIHHLGYTRMYIHHLGYTSGCHLPGYTSVSPTRVYLREEEASLRRGTTLP